MRTDCVCVLKIVKCTEHSTPEVPKLKSNESVLKCVHFETLHTPSSHLPVGDAPNSKRRTKVCEVVCQDSAFSDVMYVKLRAVQRAVVSHEHQDV